jgi:hypothetical protein
MAVLVILYLSVILCVNYLLVLYVPSTQFMYTLNTPEHSTTFFDHSGHRQGNHITSTLYPSAIILLQWPMFTILERKIIRAFITLTPDVTHMQA